MYWIKKIQKNVFEYFGRHDRNNFGSLLRLFFELGNDDYKSEEITNIMSDKIVEPYLQYTNNKYMWFTIRIFFPSCEYLERWHIDGYFYDFDSYSKKNTINQISWIINRSRNYIRKK